MIFVIFVIFVILVIFVIFVLVIGVWQFVIGVQWLVISLAGDIGDW